MPNSYIVGVREVHVRHYRVIAKDEEEARRRVGTRSPEVTDLEFSKYSRELGCDTWSVEEEIKPLCQSSGEGSWSIT